MKQATASRNGSAPAADALESERWIDKWLSTCHDLADLELSNPMMDAVIDEVDGRMIRVGERWLADFASCNYLGFDLESEIIKAVPAYLERGAHIRAGRACSEARFFTSRSKRACVSYSAVRTRSCCRRSL